MKNQSFLQPRKGNMLLLQRKRSSAKNESISLLENEGGFEGQKFLSDEDCDEPVKPWDSLRLNRSKIACSDRSDREELSYSDLNEKKQKSSGRRCKAKDVLLVDPKPQKESRQKRSLRIDGLPPSKSCLAMPAFLKSSVTSTSSSTKDDSESSNTSPPSPSTPPPKKAVYSSELQDDFLLQSPESIVSDVRYSLRTSIGDGSARQLFEPERELRPNGVRINVSHFSAKGLRPYMEDRYVVENLGAVHVELSSASTDSSSKDGSENPSHVTKMPLTFVGVFDGHGGDKASQYCADWMSSYVRSQNTYPHDLGYSMKHAYNKIDEEFCLTGHPDGTTACSASIVGGRRIICANAGDSRAIVVRKDGSVIRISRDHKPGIPDEAKRIAKLGGRVIYWQKRWRVEGLLAVSRGIGDTALKPYVTADPEVCEYDVCDDDIFLVLSSDGVWDVMSNEEAAEVIIASSCVKKGDQLTVDRERFKWAARNLCKKAKSKGSTDNFSAICVDLKSCRNPRASSSAYETI